MSAFPRLSLAGIRLTIVTLALLLVAVGEISARAHPPGNWYGDEWASARLPAILFDFGASYPSGQAWRDRAGDAQADWIDTDGGTTVFNIFIDGSTSYDWGDCPTPASDDREGILSRNSIDGEGGTLAESGACFTSGGKIFIDHIRIDTAEPYYTGTGDPTPDNQTPDLWGVLTHEFGHATPGWTGAAPNIHFDAGDTPQLCENINATDYHTMCATYRYSDSEHPARGRRWRTLEEHDLHTFDDYYS